MHGMALHNEIVEVLPDSAQLFPTSPLCRSPDGMRLSRKDHYVIDKLRTKVVEASTCMKEFL